MKIPTNRPYSQVIFGSAPVPAVPGRSRHSQSLEAICCHVDSTAKAALRLNFIFHENICATYVVPLSSDKLATISKDNVRGIALEDVAYTRDYLSILNSSLSLSLSQLQEHS